MGELKPIVRAVGRARRRLRWIRGVGGTLRALLWLSVAAALLAAYHRLTDTPIPWLHVGAGLGGLALLVGMLTAFVPRLTLMTAAGEVDVRAGWKERVSSLLALPAIQDPMERALLHDVQGRIGEADVGSLFPFSLPRETRWIPVGLAALIGAFFLPRMDLLGSTAQDQAKQKETERVAAAVEKLKKNTGETKKQVGERPMARAMEAGERLDKLAQQMQDSPPSRREMLEKISAEREKMQEGKLELQNSRTMAEKLQQSMQGKNEDTGELGEMIKEGNFKEAAEELARLRQKLNDGTLTEQEKKKLAETMGALADKLSKSNDAGLSEFEKAMSDAMQGMQNGDEKSMDNLQEMLDDMASDLAESDMLDAMMNDLETLADELSEGDGSCPHCGKPQDGLQSEGGC